MNRRLLVFLGPSLPRAEALRLARRATILPPARQGDVWRALERAPTAIALIDGVFESQPAVWHHELLSALESGVALFGGASMGALRAAELASRGMVGVGEVFKRYQSGALVDDAEVALLHADGEHAYRPLTVPLVNIRHSLEQAKKAGAITRAAARDMFEQAQRTHYQRRGWPQELPPKWRIDLKAADARACLSLAAAFVASNASAPRLPLDNPSSLVRRARLSAVHGAALPALTATQREALTDAGSRTLLLAAWGRSMGLAPGTAQVRGWEKRLARSLKDPGDRQRYAEAFALEELMLQHPEDLLPDGPARIEGLFAALAARR